MNLIKIFIVIFGILSIIGIIVAILWAIKSPPLISKLNLSSTQMNIFINIIIIFVMVLTILIIITYSNQQIIENQKSTKEYIEALKTTTQERISEAKKITDSQLLKMDEQIKTIQNETNRQIRIEEKWTNIKRKQLIESLIEEIKQNQSIYSRLEKDLEEDPVKSNFQNFITVSLEKCLSDSPIDNEEINHHILGLYYWIKVHDNKLTASRTPSITSESLKGILGAVVKNYKGNEKSYTGLVNLLSEYIKTIEIKE